MLQRISLGILYPYVSWYHFCSTDSTYHFHSAIIWKEIFNNIQDAIWTICTLGSFMLLVVRYNIHFNMYAFWYRH